MKPDPVPAAWMNPDEPNSIISARAYASLLDKNKPRWSVPLFSLHSLVGLRQSDGLIVGTSNAAPVAAPGYVMVPVEPTDDMVRACQSNACGGLVTPDYRRAIYRAMVLAASPVPQEARRNVTAAEDRWLRQAARAAGKVVAPGRLVQEAAAGVPSDLAEILEFLYGAAELDGVWFGGKPEGQPRYWWRPKLRAAISKAFAAPQGGAREPQARMLTESEVVDALRTDYGDRPLTRAAAIQRKFCEVNGIALSDSSQNSDQGEKHGR